MTSRYPSTEFARSTFSCKTEKIHGFYKIPVAKTFVTKMLFYLHQMLVHSPMPLYELRFPLEDPILVVLFIFRLNAQL